MRYASLDGGKRFRPFWTIETARLLGAEGEGVLRAAAAVEMVHCYSLVHELTAGPRQRRSAPRAAGHTQGFRRSDRDPCRRRPSHPMRLMSQWTPRPIRTLGFARELVLALARAAGFGGMIGGQVLDLDAEHALERHTAEAVIKLQAMKTGALLHYAVEAGAILGRADLLARAALTRHGRALGAAFQVADDILDVEADEAALGKRAGKDADRNKATLVAALGLDAARERRDSLRGGGDRRARSRSHKARRRRF